MPKIAELLTQGLQQHQQGRLNEAISLYERVLQYEPDCADAQHLLGVCLHQQGDHENAVKAIRKAISIHGEQAPFHSNLALVLQSLGQIEESIRAHQAAVTLAPSRADFHSNLGTALQDAGRSEEAASAYRLALALQPSHSGASFNLANVYRQSGQMDQAISAYEMALHYQPNYVPALFNLAGLLFEQAKYQEASNRYRRVIDLEPAHKDAHLHLAGSYKQLGQWREAEQAYAAWLARAPRDMDAQLGLAMARLQAADLAHGWDAYECRFGNSGELDRKLGLPRWNGEPITGKCLFIYAEQSIEDELLFGTCLPEAIGACGHAVIECDPRLADMFRLSFPTATIRARELWQDTGWMSKTRPMDVCIPLGSLPRIFRRTLESFPTRAGYLIAPEDRLQAWKKRLATLPLGLRVGISWAGLSRLDAAPTRKFPLEDWLPLLQVPGAQFISLQAGNHQAEVAGICNRLGIEIHEWEDCDPVDDPIGLAALIAALDLVISVPNKTAHLAGALGRPVWNVLPVSAGWHWFQSEKTCPWYSSMRLFRAAGPSLRPALSAAASALASECTGGQRAAAQSIDMPALPAMQPVIKANGNDLVISPSQLALHVAESAVGGQDLLSVTADGELAEAESYRRRRVTITDSLWNLENATISEAYDRAVGFHREKKDLAKAEGIYREILRLAPKHTDAMNMLGVLTRETNRLDESIQLLQEAVSIGPNKPGYLFHLATSLNDAMRREEAVTVLQRVLQLRPYFSEAHLNMGAILERMGRLDDALPYAQRAAELSPGSALAHYNVANLYLHAGRIEEALREYDLVVSLDPDYAKGHWNRSLAYLLAGRFEEGWKEYAWREKSGEVLLEKFPYPAWDGSSLAGKTILVFAEQGIGDEVMFNSCLPDVVAQAKRCVLTCAPRLAPLFARSFPTAEVHAVQRPQNPDRLWTPPAGIDFQIPAGSLPAMLRPNWESFPRLDHYLLAEPETVRKWEDRYRGLGPGLTVGISWRAGGRASEQKRRTTMLDLWQPLLQVPGIHFVNLQYGDASEDLENIRSRLGVTIHHWEDADPLANLDDAAAQIAALDLVISVGNTTIHMAGALGTPAWVVLPYVPGWRYMLNHGELPWYGKVQLFRQPLPNDWQALFAGIARRLQSQMADGSVPRRSQRGTHRVTATAPAAPRNLVAHDPVTRAPAEVVRSFSTKTPKDALYAAVKYQRAGNFERAEQIYREILIEDPDNAEVLHLLGVLAHQTNRTMLAMESVRKAIRLDGTQPLFHYNLGNMLRTAGAPTEALAAYDEAIRLNPQLPEPYLNRGIVLAKLGQPQAAIASFEQAIRVKPNYAEAYHDLGVCLIKEGHPERAIEYLNRAIEIQPRYFDAVLHLADTLRRLGRAEASLAQFNRVVELQPDNAEAQVNRAMLQLQLGQFENGFNNWEWRWKSKMLPHARVYEQPTWNGQSVPGQALLVHAEQGVGDEIMFASCYADVIARCETAVLECDSRLVPLFARSFKQAMVVARDTGLVNPFGLSAPPIHAQIAAGSLPRLFRSSRQSFPGTPYLRADMNRVNAFKDRLSAFGPGLKVGLSWQAGVDPEDHALRSIPLEVMRPLAALPGITWINLQYGKAAQSLAAQQHAGWNIEHMRGLDLRDDLDGLASLIQALDLVISVGNATVHLAGALGADTWCLLPVCPSWRWLHGQTQAHWYSSVQLIRQTRLGDWSTVLNQLQPQLAKRVQEHKSAGPPQVFRVAMPQVDSLPAVAAPVVAAPSVVQPAPVQLPAFNPPTGAVFYPIHPVR